MVFLLLMVSFVATLRPTLNRVDLYRSDLDIGTEVTVVFAFDGESFSNTFIPEKHHV